MIKKIKQELLKDVTFNPDFEKIAKKLNISHKKKKLSLQMKLSFVTAFSIIFLTLGILSFRFLNFNQPKLVQYNEKYNNYEDFYNRYSSFEDEETLTIFQPVLPFNISYNYEIEGVCYCGKTHENGEQCEDFRLKFYFIYGVIETKFRFTIIPLEYKTSTNNEYYFVDEVAINLQQVRVDDSYQEDYYFINDKNEVVLALVVDKNNETYTSTIIEKLKTQLGELSL